MSLDLKISPPLNRILLQFEQWYLAAKAKGENLPESCYLATADSTGNPSCRAVLAKGVTAAGIYFFTDYTSFKANQIATNARVALTFHWKTTEKQVRFLGTCCKLDDAMIDEYFYSRPIGSQIAASISNQSSVLQSYENLQDTLAKRLAAANAALKAGQSANQIHSRPIRWGGYQIVIDYCEFWQGMQNRLHQRTSWTKDSNNIWHEKLLSP